MFASALRCIALHLHLSLHCLALHPCLHCVYDKQHVFTVALSCIAPHFALHCLALHPYLHLHQNCHCLQACVLCKKDDFGSKICRVVLSSSFLPPVRPEKWLLELFSVCVFFLICKINAQILYMCMNSTLTQTPHLRNHWPKLNHCCADRRSLSEGWG